METDEKNISTEDFYIGPPPSWMVTKGTPLIAGILLLFLIVTSQIKYNDTIKADVVITTSVPPVYVAPKRNGILNEIRVGSGDIVENDQILAVIQNSAKTEQVLNIQAKLEGAYDTITSIEELEEHFSVNLELGENQTLYNEFVSAYQKLISFNSLRRKTYQGEGLESQSKSQLKAISNQRRKLLLSKKRYRLAKVLYSKQEGLYEKGVISQSELAEFEEKLLKSEEIIQDDEKSLFFLQIQSNELETAYRDNNLNIMELGNNYEVSMRASRQELISAIQNWFNEYVLVAPKSGRISIFDIWERFQNVEKDDYIFSIVPQKQGELLGKMKVPLTNTGRVDKNNEVIIKLDNYPFREWGSLRGKIIYISDVPKKTEVSYYSMYLKLNNLKTSFGKEIMFRQEMSGTAEIILEKKSLLERIFYQFKSIWE